MNLPPLKRTGYVVKAERLDHEGRSQGFADVRTTCFDRCEALQYVASLRSSQDPSHQIYRPLYAWREYEALLHHRPDRDEDLWTEDRC